MRSSLNLGGQDVPVVIAEHRSDQFQALAVGCFDGPLFQGIAQGVRHGLRIAEIAHESTSSLANGGDRCLPCRPVRQWRGRRKIDTFTIPKRAQAAGVSTLLKVWSTSG